MNAVTKHQSVALALPDDEVIRVLQASLYPGARADSVRAVLSWCKATGRDPMKKPIHIVPMWVKDANTGQGEMRDVLMPGIGTYRTDAANSGMYAGKSEPLFGPETTRTMGGTSVTYPAWCKVTVQRIVHGAVRDFTAMEFWTENYATAKKDTDAPNAMWKKRPYAQLAKCAESQALRMAFPDETGNTNTAEEMEGKTFDGVTIDAAPQPRAPAPPRAAPTRQPDAVDADSIPALDRDERDVWVDRKVSQIATADEAALHELVGNSTFVGARARLAELRPDLAERITVALGERFEAVRPAVDEPAEAS